MDVQENQGQATPEAQPAPDAASTQAAATPAQPSSTDGASAQAAASAEKPAWTPDFTYEFDGRKREIDPFFRALIKDEDSLKKVRDYVQRADALVKYKGKLEGYEKEWKPVVDQVSQLQKWYSKGDHERVFQALGYDDNTLFQYVRQKLAQAQMPDDQRAAMEAKRNAELAQERFSEEYSMRQAEIQQELARVTQIEMDMELAKPEYVSMQQAYDKAYGEGSFRSLVIERGAYMVDQTGSHVRPGEVLKSVARDFMPFMSASQPMAAQEQMTQQQQKPKVIPNVGKGSGSPARSAIKSLADLKKRAAQLGE
jgi:hypothetical protein